jgi:hypothetical protein
MTQNKLTISQKPLDYLAEVTNTDISIRVNSPLGCIQKLVNQLGGRQEITACIITLIGETAAFFNVQRNMTPSQMVQTSELIIKEYYHLSLEDLKHFFDMIKLGKYGTMYESFDGGKVLTALGKYDVQRETELIELRAKTKNDLNKSNKVLGFLTDEQLTLLHSNFGIKEIPKANQLPEKSEHDKLIQSYFKEFDLLYNNGKDKEGQRFVEYKGRVVSITEYCEIRIGE